ncbi:TPA: hypothetical protein IAC10_12745 [Candidatus Scatousia excrementigallinarum]|uniref:Uncharacterized protein n=1 Tax=Candidatus Scatousia excrementigallinarum TaxID=2840935 RepID=A0A9D1F0Y2_9BACT|nr:hypothetical protein [Candidatus Scatousia excrementigallinarum]
MAPHDNMTINKVGMPKTDMADAIPSYEAAAAVRDSAIQGEQGTRATEINTTTNVRKNDNTQKYQTGYEGINSMGKFLGLTMKDVFSAQYTGEGLDHFNGTHHIGKPYQEVEQDGYKFNVMIKQGMNLNIAC